MINNFITACKFRKVAQDTVMNKNFNGLCAAILAFAVMLFVCAGYLSDRNEFALADEDKSVYLTFDDGPSDRVTPKILDVLAEEDVRATFFIIGVNAEIRKPIVRREFDEGHTVAVHSYTHNYGEIYASAENLLNDIDKCNEVIKSVTGGYSSLYRFPGGSFGLKQELISAVKAHGMKYIDWNASSRDAELINPTPRQLVDAAVSTSANRAKIVLLLHDSTSKIATANALKYIIRRFKDDGYTFKTFKNGL